MSLGARLRRRKELKNLEKTLQEKLREYVKRSELPQTYEHPTSGTCPQSPQRHTHDAQEVAGFEQVPTADDLQALRQQITDLTAQILTHKHNAASILGSINADTLANLTADQIISRAVQRAAEDRKREIPLLGGGGMGKHRGWHVKGGSDAFDGASDQLSFQLEQVAVLPSAVRGRIVYLTTDDHAYLGVET
ncbi:hypothetical protein MUP01_04805 [Candidatus Bathyarchaeota archaeon]|nr:hypothetical protein [Candidatus Bathyarchaeota archaeon]